MQALKGMVAVVTGASKGIGKGIASVAQSVRFSGRVIAALAADPNVMDKSGGIYTVSN